MNGSGGKTDFYYPTPVKTPTMEIVTSGLKEIPLHPTNQEINISFDKDDEKTPFKDTTLLYSFFLFVNPSSGGNAASVLTKNEVEKMKFSSFTPKGANVEVFIYDLKQASAQKGYQRLKRKQSKKKANVRVMVGGGDGTVVWVIQDMVKHAIDIDKCPVGIIPFGTGNDFSRVLGWGGGVSATLMESNMRILKAMIAQWVEATVENFDVWEVTIEVKPEGSIQKVEKGLKGVLRKDMTTMEGGKQVKMTKMTKLMVNYWSVGIDARIGFGFDKNRTQSKCCNLCVYCWEGFKKMFLSTAKINSIIEGVKRFKTDEAHDENLNIEDIALDEDCKQNIEYILLPKHQKNPAINTAPTDETKMYLKDDPSVLLFLNIPSFMGGASDIWRESKGKIGICNGLGKSPPDFGDQKVGDGQVEILTFAGPVALAAERTFKGQARRVGQYGGPLMIKFRDKDTKGKDIVTYTQIDGEYYKLKQPRYAKIQRATEIPGGRIKILQKLLQSA
jgi:diacylglycerol kinase (ATP)